MNPSVQIPLVKVAMPPRSELMPALERVLYGGMIAEGEDVYSFERSFASKFGLRNCLGMSSGTAALHCALVAAGVRAGDEVISTSMTAEPTNLAILHAGATPVFADVCADSGNLDVTSIEELIGERTKAIMVVHYAGFPAEMGRISEAAARYGIPVIEDCAHALGAAYDSRPIGTIGQFGIFSFQAIKHMTTVDGGALTIADESLVPRARRFRWFGMEKGVPRTEIDIKEPGYKYNMHNVAATIGSIQLQHISALIARHVDNGKYFDRMLPRIPGIAVTRFEECANPTYWLYSILTDDDQGAIRCLAAKGVSASKLHRPNHLHSVFAASARELPGLSEYYRRLVHIPCGWWVSVEDREMIVDALARG